MASGKRASMREGPLAALFRRTDDAEGAQEPAAEAPEPASPSPPPTPPAAQVPPVTPAAARRRRVAEPEPEPPAHPRETGFPHPSLGATSTPEVPEVAHIPTPR